MCNYDRERIDTWNSFFLKMADKGMEVIMLGYTTHHTLVRKTMETHKGLASMARRMTLALCRAGNFCTVFFADMLDRRIAREFCTLTCRPVA